MSGEKESTFIQELSMAERFDMVSNYTQAVEHYEKAFDLYAKGELGGVDMQCCLMLKVAHLSALNAEYGRAIMAFEYVIQKNILVDPTYIDLDMLMVKLALCYIASDNIDGYDRFSSADNYLKVGDYQFQFISNACKAYKNKSLDEFMKAVMAFDKVQRLEPWLMTIILRIRLVFD